MNDSTIPDGHDGARRGVSAGFRVGLTGGIASGKSAVADVFAELGVPVIDTDEIAREVVEPGEPGLAAVAAEFGPSILLTNGGLDRGALRALVFKDSQARQRLESILHPIIRAETLARSAAAEGSYQLLVVPLLLETDFADLVDRILVVDCPPEMQATRLSSRDGDSAEQAARMIAAQIDRATRLSAADDVIDNSGSLAQTRRQTIDLHKRYLQLAQEKN